MCGRVLVLSFEETVEVLHILQRGTPLTAAALDASAARKEARPRSNVHAVVAKGKTLAVEQLSWGFDASWSSTPLFNTRIESAAKKQGMWAQAFERGRCILPVCAFFEPHGTQQATSPRTGKPVKRPYRFAAPDGAPLLLGCLHMDGRLSVVTSEPNAAVQPVHDRMPLVLRQDELPTWLGEGYARLADRSGIALSPTPELPLREQAHQESLF